MAELTLVEAVNDALHTELARDSSVMVLGEDVGRAGGVFRATAGLRERFGPDRCVDTPLAEAGILGSAVGLCMAGWRPVCEMQYDTFAYPCLDQLITHVGRYRWRTRGTMTFPLVVRLPYGGGVRAPELHDDSPETYYVHTPGVKVVIPSTPADAKGLLAAAIRDPDPVVVLEPKLVYRTARGEVPEGEHVVPLGRARLAREGDDLTIVAYGAMVPVAERAADQLDASTEVLDVRTGEARLAPGAGIDLGGIAKGWLADRLAERLAENALVNLGGDLCARGGGPSGEGWPVGFGGKTVLLREAGAATSGTHARRWGEGLHHLIDPRTGLPSRTDLSEVSVIADRAADAEILAKTALLLGAARAHEFLLGRARGWWLR